ncbi:MAG: hypothetical protein ACFCVD_02580 [Nodosilinea sp.]
MGIKLKHISKLTLSLLAGVAMAAPATLAQEARAPQTIPEAMDDLLSTYSGDYFSNRTLTRQAANIFGFGFPERELDWDLNATTAAVQDLMRLQNTLDPTIRVPDLATPYSTSLLTGPSGSAPNVGTEFIFESF